MKIQREKFQNSVTVIWIPGSFFESKQLANESKFSFNISQFLYFTNLNENLFLQKLFDFVFLDLNL